MGYTTDFTGSFECTPKLTKKQTAYLKAFGHSRRMKRDPAIAAKLVGKEIKDEARIAVGLPMGPEGAYIANDDGDCGQSRDGSILEYNDPPSGQPGLWCQWTTDGEVIEWDGGEKFYAYVEWIEYLIDHFLRSWGVELSGEVSWVGEDRTDQGKIVIERNSVYTISKNPARNLKEVQIRGLALINDLENLIRSLDKVCKATKSSQHEVLPVIEALDTRLTAVSKELRKH
jgi:hypothetical protein